MADQQSQSDLEKRFSKIKFTSLSTSCYRVVSQKYDALNTNGSLQYFGRYNNKQFPVLYTADSEEVCRAEQARRTKIRTKFTYKITKLNVEFGRIIDLTNKNNLRTLNIQKDELVSDDWRLTQHIATLAYQKGYEGLIVPSATGEGNNIVFFPDNFSKSSSIKKMAEKEMKP